MKIKIKSDAFNIAKRIKEIDKNYSIKFNTKSNKYEVYHKNGFKEILQLTLPYDVLDFRCLLKVLETKVENLKQIIKNIEENNEKIERAQMQNNLGYAKEIIKKFIKTM